MTVSINRSVTDESSEEQALVIFHAGNVGKLMSLVSDEFAKRNPGVRISREKGGSVALAKKIAMQGCIADVLATADYLTIENYLYGTYVDWYASFATTSIVLAYAGHSLYSDRITADNWHELVSRPGVKLAGGDPDVDPGGYRRIMIEKLAEKYYGQPGLASRIEANVLLAGPDKSTHSVPLVRAGKLDYVFMYKPAAIANRLSYLDLPSEVNLSDPACRDLYRSVEAMSSGTRVRGDVIEYCVTVPLNSRRPQIALSFTKLLLSRTGAEIIEHCGFQPVMPLKTAGNVPPELRQ